MEWEAVMSRQVDKLERQLESTRHESQDRAAEVVELLMVERATAAEQGLNVAKFLLAETKAAEVRQAETEVAL